MAIFSNGSVKHQDEQHNSNNTTIITTGSKIKGEMELSCNLYVDGEFEGVINSKKDVNIGKNGYIKGEIHSARLVIQGLVEGNINSERVEIKAEGKVVGSVESNEFVIEAKGIFEGNSIIKKSNKAQEQIALTKS